MIFGSLLFFFEGNFEGESPGLVSELGSTELAAGQPLQFQSEIRHGRRPRPNGAGALFV